MNKIAQYAYKNYAGDIHVAIYDSCDSSLLKTIKKEKADKMIVLDSHDLEKGQDVFVLNYYHIAHRSYLKQGSDVFANIARNTDYIRQQCESVARHTIIDIREMIVTGARPRKEFRKQLQTVMDRIWLGLHYISFQEPFAQEHSYDALGSIDEKRGTPCQSLYNMIVTQKIRKKTLVLIHDKILDFIEKIDNINT